MSAFIVDKVHIDMLLAIAQHGPPDANHISGSPWWNVIAGRNVNALGDMLVAENVKSVTARYPDNDDRKLPGPTVQYWQLPFSYKRPAYIPTVLEAFSVIDCYEYQSCEHDEWPQSEAQAFCHDLRKELTHALPGQDNITWGWDESEIQKKLNTRGKRPGQLT